MFISVVSLQLNFNHHQKNFFSRKIPRIHLRDCVEKAVKRKKKMLEKFTLPTKAQMGEIKGFSLKRHNFYAPRSLLS